MKRRRELIALAFAAVTVLALLAWAPIVKGFTLSPDAVVFASGTLASWGDADVYYYAIKYKSNGAGSPPTWYFFGIIRAVWKGGYGLYYLAGQMTIVTSGGTLATDGWHHTLAGQNDPYDYLPRNGQTWEYNSGDNFPQEDRLGLPSPWVSLPSTTTPAPWSVWHTGTVGAVDDVWTTQPACWKPGSNNIQQGDTFQKENAWTQSRYMRFFIQIGAHSLNWWGGCNADSFQNQAQIDILLPLGN